MRGDHRDAALVEVPTSDGVRSYLGAYYDVFYGSIWRWLLRREILYSWGLVIGAAFGLVLHLLAAPGTTVFVALWISAALGIVLVYEISRRSLLRDLDSSCHWRIAGEVSVGRQEPGLDSALLSRDSCYLKVGRVTLAVDDATRDALEYLQRTMVVVEYTKHARLLMEVRDLDGWVVCQPM